MAWSGGRRRVDFQDDISFIRYFIVFELGGVFWMTNGQIDGRTLSIFEWRLR